jgi:hypothetical protein
MPDSNKAGLLYNIPDSTRIYLPGEVSIVAKTTAH